MANKKRQSWANCGIKWAKKKAWSEFSRYIRLKYSNKEGLCECVTCGTIKPWKQMQAGHFVDGRGNAVLFNEDVVFPQCAGCNVNPPHGKGGNYFEYFKFMKKHTGMSLDNLMLWRDDLKREVVKYTVADVKEIHDKYKALSEKELEKLND